MALIKAIEKMTPRHETYCLCRAAGLSGAESARRAGWSGTRARSRAYELEQMPLIKERIATLVQERFKALHMDVDEVLARVAMIARADARSLYDEQGRLKPMHELTDEEAAAIAGVETVEEFSGVGKSRVKVGDVRKVRLRDPMPALRLLAEHKKLVKAPTEGMDALAGAIADRLKAARERKRKEAAS